ncbi:hypothetical protein H4R34_000067 [Dimargaris verticillata]|uniref:Cytidyltransferase-like domain-containing protein n=1 Tax=Dimargaris verticillata TaxID=2761393 RepID=A0A9W8BCK7_9FUNG|nr:hypothetical protein H4R34_000067 [Dimargaris verticillata]
MSATCRNLLLLWVFQADPLDVERLEELLASAIATTTHELTILLDCPFIARQAAEPTRHTPALDWPAAQALLALLYATASHLAAAQDNWLLNVDVVLAVPTNITDCQWAKSLDRVLVPDKDQERWNPFITQLKTHIAPSLGVLTLSGPSLATPPHDPSSNQLVPLHNDPTIAATDPASFTNTAIGGTFDHLHSGHKLLLTMAAWVTQDTLYCGVSDEPLLKTKKYRAYLEPLNKRMAKVTQFLTKINPHISYQVVPLLDPFGPTITIRDIDALICSEETLSGGHAVNKERARREFAPVQLMVVSVISHPPTHPHAKPCEAGASDSPFSLKLSSTAIRKHYYNQSAVTNPRSKEST